MPKRCLVEIVYEAFVDSCDDRDAVRKDAERAVSDGAKVFGCDALAQQTDTRGCISRGCLADSGDANDQQAAIIRSDGQRVRQETPGYAAQMRAFLWCELRGVLCQKPT